MRSPALPLCAALVAVAFACGGRAADLRKDIEYGRADGESLRLDASVPEGRGPFPVALLVHGGGWSGGDKSGSDRPGNSADITPWFGELTQAGFTWFSINYRLAPQHRWPACLDDVRTAIRWVKANAAAYKGDSGRIVLFGHSAGGQLVCLAATEPDPGTRVQAVVAFAPVTDHEQDLAARGGLSPSLQALLGLPKAVTPASRALLRELSPIHHVGPGLPPFLLLHGDADRTVPLAQSLAFQSRLRENGDACDLFIIKGAPHGLLTWETWDPGYPARMIAWLKRTLPDPRKQDARSTP